MKAIGTKKSLPISDVNSLVDVDIEKPKATGYDLLIKVNAIAVNPVDYKVRQSIAAENNDVKILGYDAVGEVVEVGDSVDHYSVGDKVFYAGDITRNGSNAEFQLVDERIVGKKPISLSNSEAAALPLTAITAWELLFEHLALPIQDVNSKEKSNDVVLVVGAAGGVGSILLQLLNVLTGATIIATASRPETRDWVKSMGADYVVDHTKPLLPQINDLNIADVTHVASLNGTAEHFDSYTDIVAPFGKIGVIDDASNINVSKLKMKSLSFHWEFMFARSMFNAHDIDEQRNLLNQVSSLIDSGHLKTTVGKHLGKINAANLRQAHAELESGMSIGKIVLEDFA